MVNDSCKDRQENEIAALTAIYGPQVIDLSLKTPLKCKLLLHGEGSISSREAGKVPSVELHVTCSKTYPNEVPKIEIPGLLKELEDLAHRLKGEVMIFDLSQHVQQFLHDIRQPAYESFYDEMVMKQKEKEEREKCEKMASELKERQQVLQEIQTTEQALKKFLRKNIFSPNHQSESEGHEEHAITTNDADKVDGLEPNTEENTGATNTETDEFPWRWAQGSSRFQNEFDNIGWLGKGAFGEVIKARNKLDERYYAIKKIELFSSRKLINKRITREVKLLSRLNHENVVRYYNSWIEEVEPENVREKEVVSPSCWLETSEDTNSDDSPTDTWIVFKTDEDVEQEATTCSAEAKPVRIKLHMYIQMELCNKSTLRSAIDNGLYENSTRVWCLFREIVEGLCHIHQQGIIHRDLKPVNIFINQGDHVKIGDFGLAVGFYQKSNVDQVDGSNYNDSAKTNTNGSLTGLVGTAMYVAPEINSSSKAVYDTKVDIFSLGIIFFEMSHNFNTGMERLVVLKNIRKPDITFPDDFCGTQDQRNIIRCMLNHDAKERPSSEQLLISEYMPPPKLEEAEVKDMLRRTLLNPQSKDYNYLITSCFNQPMQPALEGTYNLSTGRSLSFMISLEYVAEKLRQVFQRHGAVCFLPPLLTPAKDAPESAVALMTRKGSVVYATFDLRVSFARYLVRNSYITQFKRYAIDKVYKERPAGIHPKEMYECAFDIVTSSLGDLVPETEMMAVMWEILNEFPPQIKNHCIFYLSHSLFITALGKHCGLDETTINLILKNISPECTTKQELEKCIKSLGLTENVMKLIIDWLKIEGTLSKVEEEVKEILKDKRIFDICKPAFTELGTIIHNVDSLGINCQIIVKLGLVSEAQNSSGFMCEVVCIQKNKNKFYENNQIFSGRRYDKLLTKMRHFTPTEEKDCQFSIGFTFYIDKFINLLSPIEIKPVIDVLVCSIGAIKFTQEKLLLLQNLWKSGMKTFFSNTMTSLDEVMALRLEHKIPIIILLKESEPTFARIKTFDKSSDKTTEKKVEIHDVIEHIQKITINSQDIVHIKKERSTSISDRLNITYVCNEKLQQNVKRRYDVQISNTLSSTLQKIASKLKIEVLALDMEGKALEEFSTCLDLNTGVKDVLEFTKKFPRYKKYTSKIEDQFNAVCRENHNMLAIVLYSLNDNVFKILL